MSFVHSKISEVSLNSVDLSAYTNNVEFSRSADSHDVTTFGKTAKVYVSGLTDGTASIEGFYDNSESSTPQVTIRPLLGGAAVPFTWAPEGSGGPEFEVNVIVTEYVETAPVADIVTWSASLQFTDTVSESS